jgi:hypothetical protein
MTDALVAMTRSLQASRCTRGGGKRTVGGDQRFVGGD